MKKYDLKGIEDLLRHDEASDIADKLTGIYMEYVEAKINCQEIFSLDDSTALCYLRIIIQYLREAELINTKS